MPKVIIVISGGAATIFEKPDGLEVEIRDYDIEGGGEYPEDRPDCKQDKDHAWYQEMIFPAEEGEPEPDKYHNYYRHDKCDAEWEDDHSCQCDDECPVCGTAISPYKSDDIESGKTEEHHDPTVD